LTLRDKRLLKYPPTPETWICRAKKAEGTCGNVLGGSTDRCWHCGTRRPARPTRLYPDYERACAKAGIEPGTPWRDDSDNELALARAEARRKARKK
jgi:hypothetical protein